MDAGQAKGRARHENRALPHHISSIAHLFLDDDIPLAADGPAAGRRELVVAGPGHTAVTAFSTAGLAAAAAAAADNHRAGSAAVPAPVFIAERKDLLWSAASFLETGDAAGSRRTGRDRLEHWQLNRDRTATIADRLSASPGVHWLNVGGLDAGDLTDLEHWFLGPNGASGELPGRDGLVWCLLSSECVRLSCAYLLGRLVALLQPSRLEILVYPDSWQHSGRETRFTSVADGTPTSALLERCSDLATSAAGHCPICLTPVPTREGAGGLATVASVLQNVARRVLAS